MPGRRRSLPSAEVIETRSWEADGPAELGMSANGTGDDGEHGVNREAQQNAEAPSPEEPQPSGADPVPTPPRATSETWVEYGHPGYGRRQARRDLEAVASKWLVVGLVTGFALAAAFALLGWVIEQAVIR